MKPMTLAAALVAVCCGLASAQDEEARYQSKLAKPFVKKIPWVLEYEKARKQARQDKKLIMGYFTRSYSP